MASVSVKNLSRHFGPVTALDDVSIEFADGGFYGLLGPSGSGKTTLLRAIAGFEFPDAGTIEIGGAPIESLPPEKRDIGLMFQSYALFPNMSVFDNVAFGLKVRGVPGGEIRRRVKDALALVRLTEHDRRRPHQLSGGQRQRVALARATVIRPSVLLLDEPLSALDKALRTGMQVELKRIQREIGITTIFVTHDQEEALTLSDKVGVLRDGRLVQEGPPREIYDRPKTAFAATFLGEANLFAGNADSGIIQLEDGARIAPEEAVPAGAATVAVRPERIIIAPSAGPASGTNALNGTVSEVIFQGSSVSYLVARGEETIKVFTQNSGGASLAAGTPVELSFKPADAVIVAP
ncbi:ABC transporter ATP-binding protein [Acuticoccus sp. MNP-M23]|uniref:ABC transporter ATP-binding protein n=1 Tax=Acuticoccus sp. MNP-M23 TaxID=3072793 RepID=UPI0028149D02|nr:ABC transporter ATP-binding protein [Acuticoccus sp. MNP-M23]WMS43561.1 ABC transporter ATP-binding protein [Acuticoccus sp. MNP-M23]